MCVCVQKSPLIFLVFFSHAELQLKLSQQGEGTECARVKIIYCFWLIFRCKSLFTGAGAQAFHFKLIIREKTKKKHNIFIKERSLVARREAEKLRFGDPKTPCHLFSVFFRCAPTIQIHPLSLAAPSLSAHIWGAIWCVLLALHLAWSNLSYCYRFSLYTLFLCIALSFCCAIVKASQQWGGERGRLDDMTLVIVRKYVAHPQLLSLRTQPPIH